VVDPAVVFLKQTEPRAVTFPVILITDDPARLFIPYDVVEVPPVISPTIFKTEFGIPALIEIAQKLAVFPAKILLLIFRVILGALIVITPEAAPATIPAPVQVIVLFDAVMARVPPAIAGGPALFLKDKIVIS
jgi:hypothetical protein